MEDIRPYFVIDDDDETLTRRFGPPSPAGGRGDFEDCDVEDEVPFHIPRD
jgi:hypothetical protein